MKIEKLQDLKSQKGYKFNNQFFVAYEGNPNFDSSNEDYKDCIEYIKNGGIVLPEFTPQEELERAKAQKINEIGNAKEEALYAPIAYLNTSFSASERACQNMLGNLVLNGETVEWQDLNKKPIVMTRAQFQTLAVMVKNQRNASYFKESELIKKIALAKTPEELNLIKW